MKQNDMTLVEHIEELRKRLAIIVVFFLLALVVSFFLSGPLIEYLQFNDHAEDLELNAFKITDPLKIYLEVMLILAAVIISPVILYQVWAFVSPGLHENERKVTLSYIPFSMLLFLGGVAFGYFILFPYAIGFMLRISESLEIVETIGITEYFTFLFQMTLPFGAVFQLPVLMLFLTRLGVLTPMQMIQLRKYAYFILIVIAAFVTPPDIISHLMVTVPLLLLYEASIVIAKVGYRKHLKAEQQQIIEEQQEAVPKRP
ncbi:twin-arginine translocase subunit TatC [Indiicoccus explosivorum]|uniref:twin-arginine translocase subunit TatC n=1 Tax=Indiicoccus explosivorum TaxID=1917864 RepID=UPI000B43181D|nr:twin-arginine translocase subunit TatC [Indiicoccus explosivorum]